MQTLPYEILHDILQYINPNRLHRIAKYNKTIRYIVNSMNRAKYIEIWLDTTITKYIAYDDIYIMNNYIYIMSAYDLRNNLEYVLNSYWYFKLLFKKITYAETFERINNIQNQNLYIYMCT